VDSFGRLDILEIRVSSQKGQGGRGLILSHETGSMVMDTSYLCKFRSPPQFRVGGWAFGWGVGGDEMPDLARQSSNHRSSESGVGRVEGVASVRSASTREMGSQSLYYQLRPLGGGFRSQVERMIVRAV